ncbi:contractile injection system tape measure protein [Sorangium sp. So ce124]|uniref:contractile injection system tape measure protein n=1 Tax=Sorangium sp. So ce124 TaxID=3133280 RepID=UPI003F62BCF1
MTAPRHRIRRQVLEVTVHDRDAAWRLQAELGRVQARRLEAVIDRCCTELDAPGRLQRVARLEVDLGRIDPDHLERDLVDKLGPLLREALAARLREADEEPALRGGDPEVISRLELVASFARTGAVPWWADSARPRLVDETLALLLQRAARPLAALIRALEPQRGALMRIVRHSRDAQLWALFDALAASSQADLPSMPVELGALLRAHGPSSAPVAGATPDGFRACVWTGALRAACIDEGPSDGRVGFWRGALARIALEAGVPLGALLSGLHASLGPSPSAWPGALAEVGQSPGAAVSSAVGQRPGAVEERPVRGARGGDPSSDPRAAAADEALSVDPAHGDADADAVYVDNAGLVVLWPFLGHLFERLGLLADKQLKDRRALHRAAGLLQHLCTGDLEPAEYQLPLARVLSGMPMTEVFDFGPLVAEAEAEECVHLLTAAIASAPILGEMSIAGFRGSFLMRKGALSARDDAWLLRVERASHDVVLDRFPWGVSWVLLPWMAAPLCVEW